MPLFLLDILEAINDFYIAGGIVLYFITALVFFMWVLILERITYYWFSYKKDLQSVIKKWKNNSSTTHWGENAIRQKLISETRLKISQNLSFIKTLIMLCPLLGLLGTVTGMIEVFSVLSISGGSDIRSMAGGVSRATIPTMAGMVAALSGVFAQIYLTQMASQKSRSLEEKIPFGK